MSRSKPQQQLYRPGSGRLRKSGSTLDDNESRLEFSSNISLNSLDSQSSNRTPNSQGHFPYSEQANSLSRDFNKLNLSQFRLELDSSSDLVEKRKNKKPEQALYVAKPNVERDVHDKMQMGGQRKQESGRNHTDNRSRNSNQNRNGSRRNDGNFAKRHNNPRRFQQDLDRHNGEETWRDNVRQSSEPRHIDPVDINRIRDTRSVEPTPSVPNRTNWQRDSKIHSKPPSGRRNSSNNGNKHLKMPPNLPPRLRSKFFQENGISEANMIRNDDEWDGYSATFKGTGNGNYPCTSQMVSSYQMPPPHLMPPNSNRGGQMWSQTLPHTRGRGRAQMRPNDPEIDRMLSAHRIEIETTAINSHSRPNTPPQFSNSLRKSSENLSRPQTQKVDRMYRGLHTPPPHVTTPPSQFRRNSVQIEPPVETVSPTSSEVVLTAPTSSTQIFDWSEEVDLPGEMERTLSDTFTRSSSMASLNDQQPTNDVPPHRDQKNRKKRNRRKGDRRNRSNSRGPRDRSQEYFPQRQGSQRNMNRDNRNRGGYNSRDHSPARDGRDYRDYRDHRDHRMRNQPRDSNYSNDNRDNNRRRRNSRDSSGDRSRRNSEKETEEKNWREEIRDRNNMERETNHRDSGDHKNPGQAPGIIILPAKQAQRPNQRGASSSFTAPKNVAPKQNLSRNQSSHSSIAQPSQSNQRKLFDHNNPSKPIVVTKPSTRTPVSDGRMHDQLPQWNEGNYTTDNCGIVRPSWYTASCAPSYNIILNNIEDADLQLQEIIISGELLNDWNHVMSIRACLQDTLCTLLSKDIKFCQTENVEHHFWKILYHNIIELLRKTMSNNSEAKEHAKQLLIEIIDDGNKFFDTLLKLLEQVYCFKLDDYLGTNNYFKQKASRSIGLALISAQKLYLFLGDLARYREQVNGTSNYGKSKQLYIKAQQLNPKNGRPYNQLAILSIYVRRKLDAVYYYMRSLMSSNPFHSARESLLSLFDENRKKYEQADRKRREEKAERIRQHMKERERSTPGGNALRREIWIHPEGGRRWHRTTSAQPEVLPDSDEEDFSKLASSEVNKRFVTSYLHVHGKLITKIGMETFQESAIQMLKEFRALLQHSPVPLNNTRFLQLLALNMFAIETTQLKEPQLEPGYRSEVQECALVVSLQMFSVILERCVALLKEQLNSETQPQHVIGEDLQVILPAIKIWCDWMLCHQSIWNPPPSCSDYKVGSQGDAWTRLAMLMNLLEKLDHQQVKLVSGPAEGCEMVWLPEDAMLYGFTPLMLNTEEPVYVNQDVDIDVAQICGRINRILFFGTEFLCGVTPPVLKLQKFDSGFSEYISVVRKSQKEYSIPSVPDASSDSDILVESYSEDEDVEKSGSLTKEVIPEAVTPEEIRDLRQRKEELERRQKKQERHRERVQAILQQSTVSVEIEIKPRLLVPDTNCFIDYLAQLQAIAKAQINAQPVYTLMVPLVVLNELEGLGRGGKAPAPVTRTTVDSAHIAMVAEASKRALEFLRSRSPAVRCVTTHGKVVPSLNFTMEEDNDPDAGLRNDDRILTTSLSLCRTSNKDQHNEGEPRKLYRDVVLLTDDRNLRVKALARDVPVRELPDFMKWAGLG